MYDLSWKPSLEEEHGHILLSKLHSVYCIVGKENKHCLLMSVSKHPEINSRNTSLQYVAFGNNWKT